jgi:hypothetical protein
MMTAAQAFENVINSELERVSEQIDYAVDNLQTHLATFIHQRETVKRLISAGYEVDDSIGGECSEHWVWDEGDNLNKIGKINVVISWGKREDCLLTTEYENKYVSEYWKNKIKSQVETNETNLMSREDAEEITNLYEEKSLTNEVVI